MPNFCKLALVFSTILTLMCPVPASADAIVRSQAMFADTIAEYFVDDDHVQLELEIGSNDVGAFRNLLPDPLYQRLGYGDTPLGERLPRFVADDMPVFAGGNKLVGRVTEIGPATRPLRDEITGEELPTPEDEALVVIRSTIVFRFDRQSDSLTLVAPGATGIANIGFVLYHKGVAVNDYRYLSSGLTVNLDWQDAPSTPDWIELQQILSPHPAGVMIWEDVPLASTTERLASAGIKPVAFQTAANRPTEGDFLSVMHANADRLESAL